MVVEEKKEKPVVEKEKPVAAPAGIPKETLLKVQKKLEEAEHKNTGLEHKNTELEKKLQELEKNYKNSRESKDFAENSA